VLKEIRRDLATGSQRNRLLQGDVGSGKTVPTEILAEQHVQNFKNWFKPFHIEVESILGKHSAKVRKETLERIAKQKACLVIGTHALFQKDVIFNDSTLIILDEQNRFCVHTRLTIDTKHEDKITHK